MLKITIYDHEILKEQYNIICDDFVCGMTVDGQYIKAWYNSEKEKFSRFYELSPWMVFTVSSLDVQK